jgi:hypothetical protein
MNMPNLEPRKTQLNTEIDAKTLFLAKLAARHEGQTLVEFIEAALTRALPNAQWGEGFWVDTGKPDEDAVDRMFLIGIADESLLAPKQLRIFNHALAELARQGKKITGKSFHDFFDYSERGK